MLEIEDVVQQDSDDSDDEDQDEEDEEENENPEPTEEFLDLEADFVISAPRCSFTALYKEQEELKNVKVFCGKAVLSTERFDGELLFKNKLCSR